MSEDEKFSALQERLIFCLACFFVPLGYVLLLAGLLALLSLKVFLPMALVWSLKFIIGFIPSLFKLFFSIYLNGF